jgi:hypothetical protein
MLEACAEGEAVTRAIRHALARLVELSMRAVIWACWAVVIVACRDWRRR